MLDRLDLPELAPYRTLRLQGEHFRGGIFVAEGEKVVRRLLAGGLEVRSVLLPPEHFEVLRGDLEARREVVDVFVAPRCLLEALTGFTIYQGWLACARIPEPVSLEAAWGGAGSGGTGTARFWVALDGLTNAENLGGVVRSAAAFGADVLLVGETSASPYLRRAVRSSMGEVFRLPVVRSECLAASLGWLRARGMCCVAADAHVEGMLLPAADLRGDCCVVLGHEGEGISGAVKAACDMRVAVPMARGVDSLNVGAAAAVFFYEVWRQRHPRAAGAA